MSTPALREFKMNVVWALENPTLIPEANPFSFPSLYPCFLIFSA